MRIPALVGLTLGATIVWAVCSKRRHDLEIIGQGRRLVVEIEDWLERSLP